MGEIMSTKDLFELAQDPKFISGIYNYCDRWCERCAFTARCLLYAQEDADRTDPAAHDLNSEAFWEKLKSIFEGTRAILEEGAKERGVDLETLDHAGTEKQERRNREQAENHELAKASEKYATLVDEWLESEQKLFAQKRDELITMLELQIGGERVQNVTADIADAVEVIRWYQYQIHVKLMRALMRYDFEDGLEEDDAFPKDSDGSAKVALIAIDRSIGAWGALREHFPERTDAILTVLLQLDRLRRKTEQYFPNARSFVRPGFDERVE
jgi:hypothetical protein